MWNEMKVIMIRLLVVLFSSFIVVQANGQNEKPVDLHSENIELEKEIKLQIADTISLSKMIVVFRSEVLNLEQHSDSIEKKINDISDSFDKKQLEHLDSLVKGYRQSEKQLILRKNELYSLIEKNRADLLDLKNKISDLSIYSKLKKQELYNNNILYLQRRYSLMSIQDLDTIKNTVDKFNDMPGFQTYLEKINAACVNKQLFDSATQALNSVYVGKAIENLRTELIPRLAIGHDDLRKGDFVLSKEQFSELDSLDIKLSRYYNGIKELQSIVARINNNEMIKTYRKSQDKQSCLNTMKEIIISDDDNAVAVRSRYFDMIPYLDKLLKDYWIDLNDNPLCTPNKTETIIENLIKE